MMIMAKGDLIVKYKLNLSCLLNKYFSYGLSDPHLQGMRLWMYGTVVNKTHIFYSIMYNICNKQVNFVHSQ